MAELSTQRVKPANQQIFDLQKEFLYFNSDQLFIDLGSRFSIYRMNFRILKAGSDNGIFVKTLEHNIFFQIEAAETLDHDRFFHRLRQHNK